MRILPYLVYLGTCPLTSFWFGVGVTLVCLYCRLLVRGQVTIWKNSRIPENKCASAVELSTLLSLPERGRGNNRVRGRGREEGRKKTLYRMIIHLKHKLNITVLRGLPLSSPSINLPVSFRHSPSFSSTSVALYWPSPPPAVPCTLSTGIPRNSVKALWAWKRISSRSRNESIKQPSLFY